MSEILSQLMKEHPGKDIMIRQITLVPMCGWLVMYECSDDLAAGFVQFTKPSGTSKLAWSHKIKELN